MSTEQEISTKSSECDTCSNSDTNSLDEDFEDKKEVEHYTKTIDALNNPIEVNETQPLDKDTLQKFYDSIKTLPKDKLIQTLNALSNRDDHHEFRTLSEKRRKSDSNDLHKKLRAKLDAMKMSRATKQTRDKYVEDVLAKENERKKMTDVKMEELLDEIKKDKTTPVAGEKKKKRKHRNKYAKKPPATSA